MNKKIVLIDKLWYTNNLGIILYINYDTHNISVLCVSKPLVNYACVNNINKSIERILK